VSGDPAARGQLTPDGVVALVADVASRYASDPPAQIRSGTPLADLGIDSLGMAELFAAVEDAAGRELDPGSIPAGAVVADLAALAPRAD
jgi:acyl carrier protein